MQDLFKVKKCSDFGRYLIAKKDFKKGELVLEEAPIIAFPDISNLTLKPRHYVCLACYRIFKKKKVFRCNQCKWPACSKRCADNESHKQLECTLLQSSGINWTVELITCLRIIRSLVIKDQNRVKWSQLLALTSKHAWENSNLDLGESEGSLLKLRRFLQTSLNLKVKLKLLRQLSSIFAINSFAYSDKETRIGYGVIFATTSFIAHSCSPNLHYTLPKSYDESGGTWSIRLYSRRDIKAGEMLTIAYTDECLGYGTVERREHLLENFQFFCRCERCTTPSEGGTYYTGIQCCKCRKGWVLPHCKWSVRRFRMKSKHICDRCQKSHLDEDIWRIQRRFDQQLTNAINNHNFDSREKMLDVLITGATTTYGLHPTHRFVIRAIDLWVSGHKLKFLLAPSDETKLEFEKIVERSNRARFVYKHIGDDANYAKMEAYLATAMCLFYFKSDDYISIQHDSYDRLKKFQLLSKIVQHMSDAMLFMDDQGYDSDDQKVLEVFKGRFTAWNNHLRECKDGVGI